MFLLQIPGWRNVLLEEKIAMVSWKLDDKTYESTQWMSSLSWHMNAFRECGTVIYIHILLIHILSCWWLFSYFRWYSWLSLYILHIFLFIYQKFPGSDGYSFSSNERIHSNTWEINQYFSVFIEMDGFLGNTLYSISTYI